MAYINDQFNISKHCVFTINNFSINNPLNIIHNNKYLSIHSSFNLIDFYGIDDDSGRQKWIIETDDNENNIFYIKSLYNREDNNKYLGCPNKSNNVFLYNDKNIYTKWNIDNINENNYNIKYAGNKYLAF